MVLRILFPALSVLLGECMWAQANVPAKSANEDLQQASSFGYMAPTPEPYQQGWSASGSQRAVDVWKALCDTRPMDVNAQLNWFRSERNMRLERNNGTLQPTDKAALGDIADRIGNTAPGSFEQSMANYYLQFPAPAAFGELHEASAAQPERTELIVPTLTEANMHGDKAAMDKWAAALEQRGALAPALSDAASDLLLSVDRNGVVFTNGDMDTQPVLVRQRLHDERRDVLLIDQRLLVDAGYRQLMWHEAKAAGPVPAAGIAFVSTLVNATDRPVFLALGLDRSWFDAFSGQLHASGTAFRIGDARDDDISLLQKRWTAMKKPMGAGPLSRNYLLPGAVLLQNLRAQPTDEAHAAELEFELRRMATTLGATQDLINAGVLKH